MVGHGCNGNSRIALLIFDFMGSSYHVLCLGRLEDFLTDFMYTLVALGQLGTLFDTFNDSRTGTTHDQTMCHHVSDAVIKHGKVFQLHTCALISVNR